MVYKIQLNKLPKLNPTPPVLILQNKLQKQRGINNC